MDKGTYCLLLRLDTPSTITIGKRGTHTFSPGAFIYVGSALNSLSARLNRHLKTAKRNHWHIDYLLEKAHISHIYVLREQRKRECEVARLVAQHTDQTHKGFGASDCNCRTHLFYTPSTHEAARLCESLPVGLVNWNTHNTTPDQDQSF